MRYGIKYYQEHEKRVQDLKISQLSYMLFQLKVYNKIQLIAR
jgi:hypothetical protein